MTGAARPAGPPATRARGQGAAPRAAASVLDRLLDAAPDQPRDRPRTASETVAELRAAVHRDVEALLNARRSWRDRAPVWPALSRSPLGYGVADFTAGAFNDAGEREVLRAEIELAITRFEPRLSGVHVQLLDGGSTLRATLRLRIDAQLLMHPQPEPISFDTAIDVTTSDVTLQPLQEP